MTSARVGMVSLKVMKLLDATPVCRTPGRWQLQALPDVTAVFSAVKSFSQTVETLGRTLNKMKHKLPSIWKPFQFPEMYAQVVSKFTTLILSMILITNRIKFSGQVQCWPYGEIPFTTTNVVCEQNCGKNGVCEPTYCLYIKAKFPIPTKNKQINGLDIQLGSRLRS